MFSQPPAPRDGLQKLAAVGVVIAVAVGVSFGASAFKKKLQTEVPTPAPVVPVPIQTTEPVPVEAPPVEVDEEPAPEPSTPASSLKARPAWGRLEATTRGEATPQFAPQPSKPLELFLAASPTNGEIDRAFVICRAQSFGKADTFAGDDLHVRATFGTTPEVAADGPEDANLAFVSAPLVTLKKSELVHVAVFDRDVLDLTSLARVNVTYGAAPIALTDPGASIECRVLAGDALSRAATARGREADASIATLANAKLTGTTSDWSYPYLQMIHAQRAAGDVAALVGWDDARTTKRVDAYAAALAKVDAQKEHVFDELRSGANDATSVDGLAVRLAAIECGPRFGHAGHCAVKLVVTNTTTRKATWNGYLGVHAYVATRGGGPITIAPDDRELATRGIEPGATANVSLLTSDERPSHEDAIVGVCGDRHCRALRLR